ncbi:MAG TPA: hypothetical protein VN822_04130 [Candidatus Acidoferrales bacterium]|nr:hypothetical protein [Candidatus Acidoferrales bacterium]
METTKKRRREAAVLFFVVFLLGGVFGGVGDHLWDARVHGEQLATSNVKASRQQIIADSTHQLELTSDQQNQLAAILENTHVRWQALYAPLDAQKEAIRQEGRAQIREMLTPEQQAKFDAMMQRYDEQRKKDAGR